MHMNSIQFNILDSTSIPLETVSRVILSPVYYPVGYSGSIITGDFYSVHPTSTGLATFVNVVPNVYSLEVWTHKKETDFKVVIPNETSGTVSATDYMLSYFTASSPYSCYKVTATPQTTESVGRTGHISFTTSSVYLHNGSVWSVIPTNIL